MRLSLLTGFPPDFILDMDAEDYEQWLDAAGTVHERLAPR